MLSKEQLQDRSREDCLRHARQDLTGELKVELGQADPHWSPVALREVFEQSMVIWRRIGRFEVLLDEDDVPVGFVDPDKWEDCRWRDLTEWDIRDLVGRTRLVRDGFAVRQAGRSRGDCLEAVLVEEPGDPNPKLLRVRINPSRRAVISLLPEQEA